MTTATGEQRTRELGNTVAKPDVAKIVDNSPITNMQDLLNSRVSGVTLIQQNGTVGSGSRVRIRGLSSASLSNDPLVYVDGIKVETSSPRLDGTVYVGGGRPSFLNDIDPDEIESMEIVKGPSAATLWNRRRQRHPDNDKAGQASANGWCSTGRLQQGRHRLSGQYYSPGTDAATGATRQCLPWQRSRLSAASRSSTRATCCSTRGRRRSPRAIAPSVDQRAVEQVRYFSPAPSITKTARSACRRWSRRSRRERGVSTLTGDSSTRTSCSESACGAITAPFSPAMDITLSSGYVNSNNRLPQTGDRLQGIIGSSLFGTANPASEQPVGLRAPGGFRISSITTASPTASRATGGR